MTTNTKEGLDNRCRPFKAKVSYHEDVSMSQMLRNDQVQARVRVWSHAMVLHTMCAGQEVERIKIRNVQDRLRRLANRNPLCGDCRAVLAFDDSGSRRGMRRFCDSCLTRRKRAQDSRRNGVKLRDEHASN